MGEEGGLGHPSVRSSPASQTVRASGGAAVRLASLPYRAATHTSSNSHEQQLTRAAGWTRDEE